MFAFDNDVATLMLYNQSANDPVPICPEKKIWIIIAGKAINDDANIIGITPAITGLIGINVFCPPYIFLPTIFLEYCTGIFLSAICTYTTAIINTITPIITAIAVIIF